MSTVRTMYTPVILLHDQSLKHQINCLILLIRSHLRACADVLILVNMTTCMQASTIYVINMLNLTERRDRVSVSRLANRWLIETKPLSLPTREDTFISS